MKVFTMLHINDPATMYGFSIHVPFTRGHSYFRAMRLSNVIMEASPKAQ